MISCCQARLKASKVSKHCIPQPQNIRDKFDSTLSTLDSQLPPSDVDLNAIEQLVDDPSTIFDDKLIRTLALHTRWEYEDTKEEILGERKYNDVAT